MVSTSPFKTVHYGSYAGPLMSSYHHCVMPVWLCVTWSNLCYSSRVMLRFHCLKLDLFLVCNVHTVMHIKNVYSALNLMWTSQTCSCQSCKSRLVWSSDSNDVICRAVSEIYPNGTTRWTSDVNPETCTANVPGGHRTTSSSSRKTWSVRSSEVISGFFGKRKCYTYLTKLQSFV